MSRSIKVGKVEFVEVRVDNAAQVLRQIGKALAQEEQRGALRRELRTRIARALEPGVLEVKSQLRSIPAAGSMGVSAAAGKPARGTVSQPQPALSTYLAQRVKVQTKLSGSSVGVAVRIQKTPNLRQFKNAARNLNKRSWRHRVYGGNRWVEQQSPIPGYFDDTLKRNKELYRQAVLEAIAAFGADVGRRTAKLAEAAARKPWAR